MRTPSRPLNLPLTVFALSMILTGVGLVSVYSASSSLSGYEQRMKSSKRGTEPAAAVYHDAGYLKRQALWAVLGLGLMAFFYNIDYHLLKRWSFWIMVACFTGCLLVWAPGIGVEANGARRWIKIGIGQIQPSEFAKLGLIIYMAKMLDDRHRYIRSFFSGVLPAMIVTGAFALIVVVEPDFGAAFTLCCIIFGMWLCGEVRFLHLFGLVMAGVPAAVAAFIMEPYRIRRLFAFISDDPETLMREGFQLHQSLIAVGSGGLHGLGLGLSMQKHHFLFAGHTDFIFAIMAEELGFIRVSLVLMVFALLVLAGWWIALNTSDLFGSLLATGITLMVFLGVAINLFVVLGLMPTKGLVLPFMSVGGSNLLVMLSGMGILMNIAKRQFTLSARPAPMAALTPPRPSY